MKQINKEKIPFILVTFACVITSIFIATFYLWVKHDNEQIRQVELSEEVFDGEKYAFPDFTAEIKPRGGDSGAWTKDPIYDDAGNELHMPEYLWINNAWCGTMEIHQSTGADTLVQELDYATTFDKGTISYHLHRSAWDMPLFSALVILDIFWIVLFVALVISQFRIRKLLEQQKHDAMIIEQSINTFINFIEAKDPNTKGHSERVAKISYSLAKVMGYSELECNLIRL